MKKIIIIMLLLIPAIFVGAKEKKPKANDTKQEKEYLCHVDGIRAGSETEIICWRTPYEICFSVPCGKTGGSGFTTREGPMIDDIFDETITKEIYRQMDEGKIPIFFYEKNVIKEIRYVNSIEAVNNENCQTVFSIK
jgi:hypothetical protein